MSSSSEILETAETSGRKDADTVRAVHPLIRRRWSPRAFLDRPVSPEDLESILEAGRWAPSSNNEQPWRFIVARKSDGELYEKVLGTLVPFNLEWAGSAPVLLITAAKKTWSSSGAPNFHALHDTGAALENLALQATALGLHTHAMGGFDRHKASIDLQIPDDFEPVAAVALGYPGSPDTLSDKNRERELATRTRKPLSELVFNGIWNKPFQF